MTADEPAFPRDHIHEGHNGLTKREYFAAMALQGLSSKDYSVHKNRGFDDLEISRAMASTAVELADSLINELNKEA